MSVLLLILVVLAYIRIGMEFAVGCEDYQPIVTAFWLPIFLFGIVLNIVMLVLEGFKIIREWLKSEAKE